MPDNVYPVTELVGTSAVSIEDAVQGAIRTASKTLRNLDWFRVTGVRGHIEDGKIVHYQVTVKIGFRYDTEG